MNVWLTARGAGLSALVLLTISMVLGTLMSGARPKVSTGSAQARVVWQYIHRAAASLGLAVVLLHIATILADARAHVGVTGAVIPFTSSYRATWVGLGTIAAYLFVAVAVFGFARGRMASSPVGVRVWRGLHMGAYLGWFAAVLHGLNSGTDSSVTWVRALYAVCVLSVVMAVGARVVRTPAVSGTPTSQPVRSHHRDYASAGTR